MSDRAYVPGESVALALGATGVAGALAATGAQVTRNGSRGLLWAEPMVEIERDGRRTAYGPVQADDTDRLEAHELGIVDDLLAGQTRVIFGNCGAYQPTSLDAYRAHGGFSTPEAEPQSIIDEVKTAGLRGYGGAGFPAGIKWQTAADTEADQKYIVANADEGNSGTFADRLIMEGDPFLLIEGMKITGHAIGATRGVIYLRSEYPVAAEVLGEALAKARAEGILGEGFDIDLFIGAGAYICGEATSLLESLEGKRGESPREAAADGRVRALRQADRGQQRHHAVRGALDHAPRWCRLRAARRGPLDRHHALPAWRQHQARRAL